jgi:colanic acid/amylovoran biosynthesis glycosyltransferase
MNHYLFIFTNSFPFGNGYQWLKNELELINETFAQIQLFPYSYEGKRDAVSVPANTIVHTPVFDEAPPFYHFPAFRLFSSTRLPYYLKEFIAERVYTKSYWYKSWYTASQQIESLLHSEVYQQLKEWPYKEETTLYFYWGINLSQLVPFLKRMGFKKVVVRFHGFDLYKERLGGYQPYRRQLLRHLDLAAPISEMGKNYLQSHYKDIDFQVVTARLGTHSKGLSRPSVDGVFRIYSCARLIKLKRICMIAEALGQISDQPVHWTHLGDGEEMELLKTKVASLPSNVQVTLAGWVKSDQIQNYYVDQQADLFINVSTSEGVPVSVMEAMSAGIPIMATDVGGTSEIVNETNGRLLPVDLSAEKLYEEIINYINLSSRIKNQQREASYTTYLNMSDFTNLAPIFVKLLES